MWDADARIIEEERQRWVYERIGRINECIAELTVDPAREYRAQREAWVQTGDLAHLRRMLEYVQ